MPRCALVTVLALSLMTTTAGCAPATSTVPGAYGDPSTEIAPRVDDRAARAFFEIADALQQDREPSAALRRELMGSDAWVALGAAGLPGEALSEAYAIALRPSRVDERDLIDRSTSLGQMVTHVEGTYARREELLAFLDDLDARKLGVDVDRLARFVPTTWRSTRPTIALAVFGPDLREGDVFVVDLALAKDADLGPFLGHESFQWYRRQHRRIDPAQVEPADRDLMWVLDRLQARGIANQIDKAPLVDGSLAVPDSQRAQVERFRRAIAESPDQLRMMDRLLATATADPARRPEIGAQIRQLLPQGGHPTGFYMATVILEAGAGDDLSATAGDPFAFFQLYQAAASRPGGVAPAFSEVAITTVRSLAAKYTTTDPTGDPTPPHD